MVEQAREERGCGFDARRTALNKGEESYLRTRKFGGTIKDNGELLDDLLG